MTAARRLAGFGWRLWRTQANSSAKSNNTVNQQGRLGLEAVKAMFHKKEHPNVEKGYSKIEKEFADYIEKRKVKLDSDQKEMLRVYLYATVAAETGNFITRDEPSNITNTNYTRNTPLIPPENLSGGDVVRAPYEYSVKLGNRSLRDAQLYHGRGYVQLTGATQYAHYGAAAGIPDLLVNPEKASETNNAAKLLVACTLDEKNRTRILKSLNKGDMNSARAVVNWPSYTHRSKIKPNERSLRA
jgi:predicted chitinase